MKRIVYSAFIILLASCNNNGEDPKKISGEKESGPVIREEAVDYKLDTLTMKGFITYDSASSAKRPAVLIVHEWWGVNDYVRRRAKQLAELGYIAMVVDLYGNGAQGNDPETAGKLAMPFYENPQMTKARFDAALAVIKKYPQTDTNRIAAIGYCFGGSMVLNMAKLGEPLKGVVSFHGGLAGVPANKDLLKAKILVCHGAADKFISPEELATFRKQLDSIKADYTFKSYPGALHAFSNPDATANGEKFKIPIAYNAAADSASWRDMREFFAGIFH